MLVLSKSYKSKSTCTTFALVEALEAMKIKIDQFFGMMIKMLEREINRRREAYDMERDAKERQEQEIEA